MNHPLLQQAQSSSARKATFSLGLAVFGLLLAGCNTHTGVSMRRDGSSPKDVSNDPSQLPAPTISLSLSPYDRVRVRILPIAQPGQASRNLAPHDLVRYSFDYQPGQYHVIPGDQVSIHFSANPKLDFDATVRPDGRIGLGFITAEVEAAGKTPTELSEAIDQAALPRITNPGSSVVVTKANLAAAELSGEGALDPDGILLVPRLGSFPAAGLTAEKLAVKLAEAAGKRFGNALAAQVTLLPVTKDSMGGLVGFNETLEISAEGLLLVPELGAFDTNGKTVAALQQSIQAAIPSAYSNPLSVLVALEASTARMIYVDGEVTHSGAYPLTPSLSAMRAIAAAGGIRESGDLKSVIVIHRDTPTTVSVYITNLREFIEKGIGRNDLALAPQDIVIVPRSGIAKANLWVDQYITRMLPFSRGVSYSYVEGTTDLSRQ